MLVLVCYLLGEWVTAIYIQYSSVRGVTLILIMDYDTQNFSKYEMIKPKKKEENYLLEA